MKLPFSSEHPRVGELSRSFLLKQVFVGINQFAVDEYPQFAGPSNLDVFSVLPPV